MTESVPESIYATPDHCQQTARGVEVCVARTPDGLITGVAVINDGAGEMIELDPEVALCAAKAIVAVLEGRVGKSRRDMH